MEENEVEFSLISAVAVHVSPGGIARQGLDRYVLNEQVLMDLENAKP